MTEEAGVVVSERRGNVVVLRLNRPEARNAFNAEVMDALGGGVLEAEADPELRAIVITGTGDRAFCAGMDLAAFASGGTPAATDPARMAAFGRLLQGDVSVPLVAACQATAVAGGMELILTGDTITAQRALEIGLVNQVVAPDQVLDAALELAERIARNGPLGLAASKELARLAIADGAKYQERFRHWQPIVFGSEDAREGASAFVEKRDPVWKGR
jgi:enoyl-CoA hydratase